MNHTVKDAIAAFLPTDCPPFALAFSGGGDSLALLTVLKDHPALKSVLHVDHGLRDMSSVDAKRAAHLAAELGHEATILRWNHKGLSSRVQEKARRARYGLMGDYCRTHNLTVLVVAHHQDDQAETVLMRLKRRSGWRGAAGMRSFRYAPVWPQLAGVTLCRPALGLSRLQLRSCLGSLVAIEDPSNENNSFTRIAVRQELTNNNILRQDMLTLASDMAEGLTVERNRISKEIGSYHVTHEGQMSLRHLVGPSVMTLLAPIIGGQEGPLSRSGMADKIKALKLDGAVSIGGGCVGEWDGEILTLSRDPVAMTGRKDRRLRPTAVPVMIGPTPFIWDGRFLVSGSAGHLHPEKRGLHVGFRVLYGRNVRIQNLVEQRLSAALTGM